MLSTKIRTAIVVLGASSALTAATLAPAANADYKLKVTITNQVNTNYSCEDAKGTYENYGVMAENAQEKGDLTGFNSAVNGADKTWEVAKAHGCSWAAATIPPTTKTSLVVSSPVRALL